MNGYVLFGGLFLYMIARAVVFQGGLALVMPLFQSRLVDRRPVAWTQIRSELIANLMTYFNASVIFSVAIAWRFADNTAASLWPTFLLSFVWWEIWFYASHRAFHSRWLWFIHRQHHVARVNSPLSTMSFSGLESTLLLIGGWAPMLFWQNWIPVSFAGVALYTIVNFLQGLYLHSNIEFLPASVARNSIIGELLSTPTFHSLHHSRGKGHFGLFTPILDRVFGTTHADYAEAYDKVVNGSPGATVYPVHIRVNLRRNHPALPANARAAGYEKCS